MNLRPPPPHGGTLPSCATSRFIYSILAPFSLLSKLLPLLERYLIVLVGRVSRFIYLILTPFSLLSKLLPLEKQSNDFSEGSLLSKFTFTTRQSVHILVFSFQNAMETFYTLLQYHLHLQFYHMPF